jgi:hypothetical protein
MLLVDLNSYLICNQVVIECIKRKKLQDEICPNRLVIGFSPSFVPLR